jgi:hypothetical protein
MKPTGYDWQATLWREWHFCHDEEYATQVYKLISGWAAHLSETDDLEEQGRPYATQVEVALQQACQARPRATYRWDKWLKRLKQARGRSLADHALLTQLQERHWAERFIARHLLVDRGGEVVAELQDLTQADVSNLRIRASRLLELIGLEAAQNQATKTRATALWLLESIGFETAQRLASDAPNLLCPTCLVRCGLIVYKAAIGLNLTTYYGCKACGQSRTFRPKDKAVVAVLDETSTVEQVEQPNQIRRAWLKQRLLFDFDWVEIIQARDEAVERFAVQVGNDIDPFRKPRYPTMCCHISPACHLSANTLKVLDSIFGEVL